MPDKQKDSKIMSMLERKGIIRRAGNDASDAASSAKPGGYDKDIKPIFDQADDAVTVKAAARQPVPGMPTPVFPSEKSSDTKQGKEKAEAAKPEKVDLATPPPAKVEEAPKEPEVQVPTSAAPSPLPTAPPPAPVPQAEAQKASPFGGLNIFGKNGNGAAEAPPAEAVQRETQPRPENYTDRYLNVNELYDALALRSKKTDTIYLIEDYLQTLPDSLPDSSRRDIVSKLLAASGFDFDLLMGDGVLRVKMLKEYAERFARHTDDYIAARQAELDELDQQIMRTRRLIENRKELHKKQFLTIEAEAQRLKEILTFISG
ncbi:MAG: hypothetical protein FWD44_10245 [Oscillospiraceae bacterium]|nr:hypothetical protein [Oscillospiraceae bacterium]